MKSTKTTLTAVLAVILATGLVACKVDTGISDLADTLADAFDDDCRVAMRQNENNGRGDPHDDDDESEDSEAVEEIEEVEDSEESDPCETETASDDASTESEFDDSEISTGAVGHGEQVETDFHYFDDGTAVGIPIPAWVDYEARYFMGTYQKVSASSCDQDYIYQPWGYAAPNLPSTIRAYSNVDVNTIDFEDSNANLLWIADVYEDDTFDFRVQYIDTFGHPSETIDCTCEIIEEYNGYTRDRINCVCDPAQSNHSCTMIYDKI